MSDHTTTGTDWWRNAVVYQIYPRSFADGNGDGTGDIAGMRARLPYLAELGIDAIWVNPWYRSPLNDGGYDVADYRNIDERFGSIDDAQAFVDEAGGHGIRVIVDLVPNHTSSEHAWFQAALAAGPGSPERERYHFLPGRGDDGELPPSDWTSVFGGRAWERCPDGEWYLHLFDSTQPDLNWEHPEVRAEFESILRFWLDRGVAGFRVDVAHALAKHPDYEDVGDRDQRDGPRWTEGHPFWDRDEIHPIIRSWRRVLDEYDDRMMVAEAWVRADRRPLYLRPDEYHQAFDFEFLSADWDAEQFGGIIEQSTTAARDVGSNPTWVLSNHDVVRHATRYGLPGGTDSAAWLLDGPHHLLDAEQGHRRARAAALLTLALPGSAYVYQGEELGLPEAWDLSTDVLDDPVWTDSGHRRKGRDGCRVPIPWEATGPSLGFGDAEGWLPQPVGYAALAAAVQHDDDGSTLNLYRSALRIRREHFTADFDITMIDLGADVLAFERGNGARCVVNMGAVPIAIPEGVVLLASAPLDDGELPADAAVWLADH
ncbi:MAG: glycoside hydrolase family 13 protein [Ilumatobacter sp.]|uniref:glycoside hydrolase family 13 protein n=1 Tax=Ilumatobacter sp. TaxID=1967498 RepID=UPI00329A23F5